MPIQFTAQKDYEYCKSSLEKVLGVKVSQALSEKAEVSDTVFKVRVLFLDKELGYKELLSALAIKIHEIEKDFERTLVANQPLPVQKIERLQNAKDIYEYVSTCGKDEERNIDRVKRKVMSCILAIVKAPSKLAHHIYVGLSHLNHKTLEKWRKFRGEDKEILAANSELRGALSSTDPSAPSFETLYSKQKEKLQAHLGPTQVRGLDQLLKRKNGAINQLISSIKNFFRKEKKEIQSNSLLKEAFINKKIEDANFIIKNKLYSRITTSLLADFTSVPYLSEPDKREILTNFFHTAPEGRSLARLTEFLVGSGRRDLAVDLIRGELEKFNQNPPNNDMERVNACRLMAAQLGDNALIEEAFGIDLNQDNVQLPKELLLVDSKGKTLLHYACQSDNGKFVKIVADSLERQYGMKNPFFVPDKQGNLAAHNIKPSLAHQLDITYGLNGNEKGSFSSMAFFMAKLDNRLSRGLIVDSIFSGKFFGVSDASSIAFKSDIVGPTLLVANAPALGGMAAEAGLFYGLQKMVDWVRKKIYASQLTLSLYEHRNEPRVIPEKVTLDPSLTYNQQLNKLLKKRDVEGVVEALSRMPPDYKISTSIVKLANEVRYFPPVNVRGNDVDSRELIMDRLFLKCTHPDQLEKMLDVQMINGGKDWVEKKLANIEGPISQNQRMALMAMAIKLGRKNIVEKAASKIPKEMWVSWQNSDGDTLLHLACRSRDVETILTVAKKMSDSISNRQEVTYDIEKSKQSLLSLSGMAARYTGKRSFSENIFNIQNGSGERVQDLIPRNLANQLDDALDLDPAATGSFSHLIRLRERESPWTLAAGLSVALPTRVLLGIYLANLTSGVAYAAYVAGAAYGGVVGFLSAAATEFTLGIVLAVSGAFIQYLGGKKVGQALSCFENSHRGYDNTVAQLGRVPKEVRQRIADAMAMSPVQQEALIARLNPVLNKLLEEVIQEAKIIPIFNRVEEQEKLDHMVGRMRSVFDQKRKMPDIIRKFISLMRQVDFSEDQRKKLAEMMQAKFQLPTIFQQLK